MNLSIKRMPVGRLLTGYRKSAVHYWVLDENGFVMDAFTLLRDAKAYIAKFK